MTKSRTGFYAFAETASDERDRWLAWHGIEPHQLRRRASVVIAGNRMTVGIVVLSGDLNGPESLLVRRKASITVPFNEHLPLPRCLKIILSDEPRVGIVT